MVLMPNILGPRIPRQLLTVSSAVCSITFQSGIMGTAYQVEKERGTSVNAVVIKATVFMTEASTQENIARFFGR